MAGAGAEVDITEITGGIAGASKGTSFGDGLKNGIVPGAEAGAIAGVLGGAFAGAEVGTLEAGETSAESNVRDIEGKPPFEGEPNSTVRGPGQSRTYGDDGFPETDRDAPHLDEGPPGNEDHSHDWTRPEDGGPPIVPPGEPNPYRGPPRLPEPDDPALPRGYDSDPDSSFQFFPWSQPPGNYNPPSSQDEQC